MSPIKPHNTITVTISIPKAKKKILDQLYDSGFNRSFLVGKMLDVLEALYNRRLEIPGGLHGGVEELVKSAQADIELKQFPEMEKSDETK